MIDGFLLIIASSIMREYNGYIVTRSVLTYIEINTKLCIQSAKCSDKDIPDTMWWSLMLLIDGDLPLRNPTRTVEATRGRAAKKHMLPREPGTILLTRSQSL
jgi:hypothetical protein